MESPEETSRCGTSKRCDSNTCLGKAKAFFGYSPCRRCVIREQKKELEARWTKKIRPIPLGSVNFNKERAGVVAAFEGIFGKGNCKIYHVRLPFMFLHEVISR